jgi:CubicO group peptidase (beta-lactamase class C family)
VKLRRHAIRRDRRRLLYVSASKQLAAIAQQKAVAARALYANAATPTGTTSPQAVSHPVTSNVTAPSSLHIALWLCIHNGEGAWNANTGNGYYGGLQMTYGWDGLVGNAALLSPEAQMAAAETGYRQSGYSVAWLESQWPNTSPPCLGYR